MRATIVATLVMLAALGGCGGDQRAEYVLGAAGPWQQGFGDMNHRGIELAVAQINAAGGIRGARLRIDYQDDGGEGSRAVAIAQRFIANPSISAVIGHVTSGAMLAAARVYDGHVPAVATTASSPALSGISRWAFRVISSDSANGAELARAATARQLRRVAILYENDGYGRGLAQAFRGAFGGQIVSIDPIESGLANAEPYIAFYRERRPDLVFVAGTEASGAVLLREARRQNLGAAFMGGDGWTGIVSDAASEGAFVGAPFSAEDPRLEAQQFVRAFRERFRREPDGNAALAYDATRLLAAAIGAVGPTRTRIRDWLEDLDERSAFAGVTGPIRFLRTGDPVGRGIVLTRVRAGRLVVESVP